MLSRGTKLINNIILLLIYNKSRYSKQTKSHAFSKLLKNVTYSNLAFSFDKLSKLEPFLGQRKLTQLQKQVLLCKENERL